MPFGQHQDTELWNNQFPETKILGLPVSRRMSGLVYTTSRDKVDVDIWRPVLVKIVIIKLPHKSVFSATVVLFISLLCIFIGGTIFFSGGCLLFLAT